MSSDYTYDEQGQFFPFFILTITGLVTIPITYNVLKPSKDPESTAPRIDSGFRPSEDDLIEKQRRKLKRKERKVKRIVAAAIGWLTMALMVYLIIVTARTVPKVYDPYEVLGISQSASEKEITKHYRKLSLTLHPDKVRLDPAKNETVESASDHWVEVTKAFKTLTDEEIRNNYIQYGHPDGKQSFSIGIALPKFIVSESNGKYVLVIYAAVLGVLLPYLVGRWWYGTQSLTREKILVTSAGHLFREYREDIDERGVISALSAGDEYKQSWKSSEGLSKVENRVLTKNTVQNGPSLTQGDKDKLQQLDDEQRRKALALLWAYLYRLDLDDATLTEEKYEVAPTAALLNDSFSSMTLAFGNLQPLSSAYHAFQSIVQAIPPGGSPLLQLPYFDQKVVDAISNSTKKRYQSVQSFMQLPDLERQNMLVGSKLLTSEQYKTAVKVASQLPLAKVEKAFFKVTGERFITPGSLIQFIVKVRIIPPGFHNPPPVNELDLEDVDAKEGDLDALHGRNKKVKDASGKIVTKPTDKPVQPPLAHAPYFAQNHSPRWRVFLAENKSGKIAVPPFTFSTFDKPIFNEDGTPTYNVQTLKMQFGAPPQSGSYPFTMHLMCDSYVGLDSVQDVTMIIEDASKATDIEEEDEISEPEEDSLAGQMSALKGAAGGAEPRKKSRKVVEEDSSDDSDTEGEENSNSDTDTDTDTDEEA